MARTTPRVYTEAGRQEQQNDWLRNRRQIAKEKVSYARALSSSWPLAFIPRIWKTDPCVWERGSLRCTKTRKTDSIAHSSSAYEDSQKSSHDNPTQRDSLKPLSTIEALPLELLEMIIQIALDLDEQHKPTSVPKVWEAYPGRRRKRPPGQSVSRTALPLILSCKTLCTITHAIILSHVQFWSPHHWRRDALLKSLDQASLLPKLRHVAIKLGNDDDNTWDGKGTLERLPDGLLTLSLATRFEEDYASYIYVGRIQPAFQQRLEKFRNLRHLELDFTSSWLSLNLWCAKRPVSMTSLPKSAAPPPPMFPNLQHLYLNGCLSEDLGPEDLIFAFSRQQLPSLQSLVLDRLLYQGAGPPVFVPEAIIHMNPLREFSWLNYNFAVQPHRGRLGDPHELPMRGHLEALKQQHGATLELLTLNYNGEFGRPEYDFTEEYLKDFIREIPRLNKIYIDIPGMGVKIRIGPSTLDDWV
ncbi:hypothetical protein AARAC_011088 [Aspergillus arachidicola]|uniref:Uncharacterized protein n=1 Tax=Aspergillus arachidicola TaxID=656916 RepID=A0A2G7FV34_9EURO|nr:hypothetical protein AARAC_011088 [Aspergillus arachidicola]